MSKGEAFNRANVTIDDATTFKAVRAIIYDDTATLIENDGTVDARMSGPITITDASQDGAVWTNGTDTWVVKKAGCACRGE